jgi:hypothetical protein
MYHIIKQTRLYSGHPYCGYSSNNMPMAFSSLEEARRAVRHLQDVNPVGWNIFEAETEKLIDGHDYFKDSDDTLRLSNKELEDFAKKNPIPQSFWDETDNPFKDPEETHD